MPQLSVVIPTFNERENVPLLIGRLAEVLAGLDWEAIVVDDDSPDGTAAVARGLARGSKRGAAVNDRCDQSWVHLPTFKTPNPLVLACRW